MSQPTVAIAGATGFIGRWFIELYSTKFRIVALSRQQMAEPLRPNVIWRKVDMYSLSSTTAALEGVNFALYLVHSMQPSTRLSQSSFEDTDLLLADNFARAAEQAGVQQIIFMGGILPKESHEFSRHLQSRYEVEQTLGGRKTPLTSLRAGIIIGPGGSSFQIVEKLINRLPVMLCPKWTLSKTQPVGYLDVLTIIEKSLGNPKAYHEAIEIGGGKETTYMEMLQATARIYGKKRIIKPVPFFSLGMSKLWVALFSDSSTTFVSPLVESLRHEMTVKKHPLIDEWQISYEPIEDVIFHTKQNQHLVPKLPRRIPEDQVKNTVRSVQRLPLPKGKNAVWVAETYLKWLPQSFGSLIRVSERKDQISFVMLGQKLLTLQFIDDRSDESRQLFYIVGGLLVKRTNYGWLEFRAVLDGEYAIAAIHEFVPRLPWFMYINTQARIHLWVMNRFGRFLENQKTVLGQ